jgi:hypothetical protein
MGLVPSQCGAASLHQLSNRDGILDTSGEMKRRKKVGGGGAQDGEDGLIHRLSGCREGRIRRIGERKFRRLNDNLATD